MTNKNYAKGAKFEREVKTNLEENDFLVIRSTGSKKPDLIAIAPEGKDKLMITCKYGTAKDTKKSIEELRKTAVKYGLKLVSATRKKGARTITYKNIS